MHYPLVFCSVACFCVWQNAQVAFLCWIGLKWVPLLGFTLNWKYLTCFGQWVCVLHTLPNLCLNAMPCTIYAHTRHPLGTHHASPHARTCTVAIFMHFAHVYMFYYLKHAVLTVFCSVLSLLCYVLSIFTFVLD